MQESACLHNDSVLRTASLSDVAAETVLPCRWQEHHDTAAGHDLISRHLRLVSATAMDHPEWGTPLQQLIKDGYADLKRALWRYKPVIGADFVGHAMGHMRAAVLQRMWCASLLRRTRQPSAEKWYDQARGDEVIFHTRLARLYRRRDRGGLAPFADPRGSTCRPAIAARSLKSLTTRQLCEVRIAPQHAAE